VEKAVSIYFYFFERIVASENLPEPNSPHFNPSGVNLLYRALCLNFTHHLCEQFYSEATGFLPDLKQCIKS
jgi:hypothetical protein